MNNTQMSLFGPQESPSGNTKMVDYGIQNEGSDYRVHVGYKAQRIYVFSTKKGRDAMFAERSRGGRVVDVHTGDVVTAWGVPVPVSMIDDLRSVVIPQDIYRANEILEVESTSMKGAKALRIVVEMLKRNLVPLPVSYDVANEKSLQINGTDIVINSMLHVQVKCDFKCGERTHGGTGNLFLQSHECNPHRQY